jgi:hypothetical protein
MLRKPARLLERAGNASSLAWSLCQGSYLRPAVDVRTTFGARSRSIRMDAEMPHDHVHDEDAMEWLTRRFAWEQELDHLGRQASSNSSSQAL